MMVRLLRASAACLAVVALAGCSWRLETPPPDWPSPGPVTEMRDAAAEREQAVIHAIAVSAGAGTPQTVVLSEIEGAAAPERLDALGGLYVPYPDSSPSPATSAVPTDVAGAATTARDGHLADALVADDEDLAFLLASSGLSHAVAVWYGSWVEDAIAESTEPIVAERLIESASLPESGPVPTSPQVAPETMSELVLVHDQARFSYEILAARAADEERDQWLARRDLHAARATALAQLPGVEDGREAVYVMPDEALADSEARLTTAQSIETGAGDRYAALLDGAAADDVPWLLHAAFDAYAQAAAYGEPTAEAYGVPALPGLAVGPAD